MDGDEDPLAATSYRLFVNDERTVFVRLWADDKTVEVATRDHSYETWGPPTRVKEETT